ncbi:MAG: hypothetical protein COB53_10150 [Elusimicrobia bacterium]|nr:MAG: hypothetical protein COB53_10150 [Elusimicrobiota bacterium]
MPERGWVLYDSHCPLCCGAVDCFKPLLRSQGFECKSLQSHPEYSLEEMRVLRHDGKSYGGSDALIHLAGFYWWATPIVLLSGLPGVSPILRGLYGALAKRRHCVSGRCTIHATHWGGGWIPLALVILLAPSVKPNLPPWGFMCLYAFSIYTAFKFWTLWRALGTHSFSIARALGYFFFWPGMDPVPFSKNAPMGAELPQLDWPFALGKLLLGLVLVWVIPRFFPGGYPILTGWTGMIGSVFILHFGSFHLLALFWKWIGVDVQPLMNAPHRSKSVTEFWGKRWNLAFRDLSFGLAFGPTKKIFGPVGAIFFVFFLSGIVHDLVVSYPAGGGYGLPTLFFLVQGAAMIAERRSPGLKGRTFTVAVLLLPAPLLFHRPFIEVVILPFMKVLGAL